MNLETRARCFAILELGLVSIGGACGGPVDSEAKRSAHPNDLVTPGGVGSRNPDPSLAQNGCFAPRGSGPDARDARASESLFDVRRYGDDCEDNAAPADTIGQTYATTEHLGSEPNPGPPPSGLMVYHEPVNPTWEKRTTTPGVVLSGAQDIDDAMKWMIKRSGGGNFVVLRADNYSDYNSYLYPLAADDGTKPLSVTTLVINSKSYANSPYVEAIINNAEAIYIAGGDQSEYWRYWHDETSPTKLETALNNRAVIVPIGGGSAGCAIQGEYLHTALRRDVYGDAVPKTPYNENITIGNNFIKNRALVDTILEVHFSTRKRMPRLVTFLARIITDFRENFSSVKAWAIDEYTAVCLNSDGTISGIFGDNHAYFLQGLGGPPETCAPGAPLTWRANAQAIKVQKYSAGKASSNRTYFVFSDSGVVSSADGGSLY